MFRIPLTAILICCITLGFAQDSARKAHAVKPAPKYKAFKYHSYKYSAKHDTGKLAARQPISIKPDTLRPAVLTDKSLNGQYRYLLTKIYHYQQPIVSALWKSATDTLNLSRRRLKDAQARLIAQGKQIDSLKADVTNKDQSLNASNARVDEVSVLGIPMSKTGYNLLVWGLVIAFGATAAAVIARSAGYRHEAKYRSRLYEELEEEFKAHKSKANEKEKKLARELQTERNKLDELLGRG